MITFAGRGTPPDQVEGLKWVLIAIAQGHEKAELVRPQLEKDMSPEQLKDAANRAKPFKPKPESN